ncbi:hypothetical protein AB6Q13_20940 [Ralstonia solanacearum]|uniref:Uncharacterized protein n=1 Tax=Ralstonia solanacearum TaxID=305 RepID=A0AAW5ZHY4_RALSL|nr:hypothetical protein [Ralstonia solanacearum]MDB0568531.1 hypothetical protein [Ralstonia solanacearum]MDB0569785.1 hypothetical protein [Ralstonia solanacearum]MDB0578450.1 hypothetical protein [Ralstonia solanacearum]
MSTAASRQRKAGCSLTPVKAAQRFEERPILFFRPKCACRIRFSAKKDAQNKSGRQKLAGGLAITAEHILAEASPGFIHRRENLNIEMHDHD